MLSYCDICILILDICDQIQKLVFVFRIFVTVGRGAREGDDSSAGGGASP